MKFVDRIIEMRKITSAKRNKLLASHNLDRYFYDNDFVKYYGGHQHRLGHYFRHLFQAAQYVNNQNRLDKKGKYFYMKTLRAQLSTYEQEVLFINSLSFLGMSWELFPEYKKSKFDIIFKLFLHINWFPKCNFIIKTSVG